MPAPTLITINEGDTNTAATIMVNFNALKNAIMALDTTNILTKAALHTVPYRLEGAVPLGTDGLLIPLMRRRIPNVSRLVHVSARVLGVDCQIRLQYSDDGSFAGIAPHLVELFTSDSSYVTVTTGVDPLEWSGIDVAVTQQLAKSGRIRLLTASAGAPHDLELELTFKTLLALDNGSLI